jgi:hypothetical protein
MARETFKQVSDSDASLRSQRYRAAALRRNKERSIDISVAILIDNHRQAIGGMQKQEGKPTASPPVA